MRLTLKVEPQEKIFIGPYVLASTEQTKLTFFSANVPVLREKDVLEFHGIDALAGNVRELNDMMQRVVPLSRGDKSGVEDIISPEAKQLDQAGPATVTDRGLGAQSAMRPLVGRTVANVERDLILETLKQCLGNRTHAANILGISIRTLRNKLNEYAATGVPVPAPHGATEGQLAG